MGRTLTVEQAAERLQVKPNTIRAWIKQGRIPGLKIGRVFRIPEEGLEALISERHAAGQPKDDIVREKNAETRYLEQKGKRPHPGIGAGPDSQGSRVDCQARRRDLASERERLAAMDSAMGMLSDMGYSSEDFMRDKQEELDMEERRLQVRHGAGRSKVK